MKNLMRHIAMVALVVALAAGGYMAYQHYFATHNEVEVQLLNNLFGGNNSGSYDEGYDRGYEAGYAAAEKELENN